MSCDPHHSQHTSPLSSTCEPAPELFYATLSFRWADDAATLPDHSLAAERAAEVIGLAFSTAGLVEYFESEQWIPAGWTERSLTALKNEVANAVSLPVSGSDDPRMGHKVFGCAVACLRDRAPHLPPHEVEALSEHFRTCVADARWSYALLAAATTNWLTGGAFFSGEADRLRLQGVRRALLSGLSAPETIGVDGVHTARHIVDLLTHRSLPGLNASEREALRATIHSPDYCGETWVRDGLAELLCESGEVSAGDGERAWQKFSDPSFQLTHDEAHAVGILLSHSPDVDKRTIGDFLQVIEEAAADAQLFAKPWCKCSVLKKWLEYKPNEHIGQSLVERIIDLVDTMLANLGHRETIRRVPLCSVLLKRICRDQDSFEPIKNAFCKGMQGAREQGISCLTTASLYLPAITKALEEGIKIGIAPDEIDTIVLQLSRVVSPRILPDLADLVEAVYREHGIVTRGDLDGRLHHYTTMLRDALYALEQPRHAAGLFYLTYLLLMRQEDPALHIATIRCASPGFTESAESLGTFLLAELDQPAGDRAEAYEKTRRALESFDE